MYLGICLAAMNKEKNPINLKSDGYSNNIIYILFEI